MASCTACTACAALGSQNNGRNQFRPSRKSRTAWQPSAETIAQTAPRQKFLSLIWAETMQPKGTRSVGFFCSEALRLEKTAHGALAAVFGQGRRRTVRWLGVGLFWATARGGGRCCFRIGQPGLGQIWPPVFHCVLFAVMRFPHWDRRCAVGPTGFPLWDLFRLSLAGQIWGLPGCMGLCGSCGCYYAAPFPRDRQNDRMRSAG